MNPTDTESLLELADLIFKHHEGRLDSQQQADLEAKLAENDSLKSMLDSFGDKNKLFADLKMMNGFDTQLSLVGLQKKYAAPRVLKLWSRIAVAAVIAILLSTWIYTSHNLNNIPSLELVSEYGDIAPGKNIATLTFANGNSIRLSESKNGIIVGRDKLSYNDGSPLSSGTSSPEGGERMLVLRTPRGGTYQITLSDGTKVWLNAASTLTYKPVLNSHGERRVKLEGEGYFEVEKDKNRPFIVESAGQEVEVLGTHFNINAYKDEGVVKTTLLEGSVKVAPLLTKRRGQSKTLERPGSQRGVRVLKPNQQSVFKNNEITIEAADPGVTDWKNGDFYLDRIDFRVAMRKIARWYNVEIIYAQDVPDTLEVGGWISRNNKLSEVLKSIEKSGIARFKIEGHKVYVYR